MMEVSVLSLWNFPLQPVEEEKWGRGRNSKIHSFLLSQELRLFWKLLVDTAVTRCWVVGMGIAGLPPLAAPSHACCAVTRLGTG